MDFATDMMGDEPDDPFAVGRRHGQPGVSQASAQTVDPETPVGIEHDLDDLPIIEPVRDRGAERCPEHLRSAARRFGTLWRYGHAGHPVLGAGATVRRRQG